MRRYKEILQAGVLSTSLVIGLSSSYLTSATADTANAPSLVISQLKITSSNGQFITLYNTTNAAIDMSKYQLEYFNHYDLTKATSSRLVALSGIVPPHSYFMVNDSAQLLCYQLTIDSVSLGFSSTTGLVEVLAFNQTSVGGSATPVLQDYVGWSKTAAAGAQTLPASTNAFLQRLPVDKQNNPTITGPGVGSWQSVQPDNINPCNLITTVSPAKAVPTGLDQLLPPTEPAATIIEIETENTDQPVTSLPAADIGLMKPIISELLPNPAGTGNDDTDEFIELYNPNPVPFNLTGFKLQTGTTSLHIYSFPVGASLPPLGFSVFRSAETDLTLSNSGSQAKLLDPASNTISASEVYGIAKDGLAWALANGKWYWSARSTPGAANVIEQIAAKKKLAKTTSSKAKSAKSKAAGRVKGAKTTKTKPLATTSNFTESVPKTPVHFKVLALIGGLALIYGAYEYRADLANQIHQLRSYLRARRSDRS